MFRMSRQLLLTEEVAGPLVGVIGVNDRSTHCVLLRIGQVARDAVRVAEVVLGVPVRSPSQPTRGAATMISMRAIPTVSGWAAGSLRRAATLATSRLVDAISNAVPVGVVACLCAVNMIADHAGRRIAGLELPGGGSVHILPASDHAGRSATAGGHRQSQHRSLEHYAKWHDFPPSVDSLVQ